MKKFIVFFALLSFTAVNYLSAQDCGAHKKSSTSTSAVQNDDAVAKAAAAEGIERRVCEKSEKVSYWRKDVCAHSGKVSFSEVEWNAANSKFVNVSPSEKACCTKDGKAMKTSKKAKGKACCEGGKASATKTSATEEKAGCGGASATSGKSCCAKKTSSTIPSAVDKVEVIKVNNSDQKE
jgi:hypothetical protein